MTTDLYGTLLQASSTPSRSLPSHAPPVGGVRISTCSFQLTETFQTSAEELYRTFLEQEVSQPRTSLLPPPLDLLVTSISTFSSFSFSSFTSFLLSSSCSSVSSCFSFSSFPSHRLSCHSTSTTYSTS